MKTQRLHIFPVIISLAILLFIFSSFPARAGQTRAVNSAPRTSTSSCTQLYKSDGVQTPTEINFDDLPANTIIGSNYELTYGVTFIDTKTSFATIMPVSSAPSQPNAAVNLANEPDTSANQPITILFDNLMSAVGMTIGGGDGSTTTATLSAYDIDGNLICSVTTSPVPYNIATFVGLKDDNGAEIHAIELDYGDVTEQETLDDFLFTNYIPPIPCDVALKGAPASVLKGSRVVVSWEVAKNSYYSTQTYLEYDYFSHPQTGPYPYYHAPSSSTGTGTFSTGILAENAGTMYIRPALTYQETAGSQPKTCLGSGETPVTIIDVIVPPPTPGSLSGSVTTPKGVGLTGVKVDACLAQTCQSDTSKTGGAYAIPNLTPGDYTLTATKAGYNPFNSRATVGVGHATTAYIILQPIVTPPPPPTTGTIQGHVLEQGTSTPVNAASLDLRPNLDNSSTYFATATSDAGGNFTFNNVPVGDWVVFASQSDYFMWLRGYHVTAGGTASGDIQLRRRYHAPTPTPGAALDLSVAHVMPVQASQNWANSLPLAAGRATAVRVFVDLGSSNAADLHAPVSASLNSPGCLPGTGLDSNYATPLPVSDWADSNAQRSAVLGDPVHTLNFNLPLSCTTPGTHHFTVRIWPTNSNPERSFDNNSTDFDLTFQERRLLIMHVVRVSLREFFLCPGSAVGEPPWSAVGPSLQSLQREEPTVVYIQDAGTDDFCASPRADNALAGWWWINLGLSIRFLGFAPIDAPGFPFLTSANVAVQNGYGLVNGAECADENCTASGSTPMPAGYGWVSSGLSGPWPDTAAHETGHSRGLLHASNYHGESGGGSWTPWPYLHGAFSQLGPNEAWGYDPLAVDDTHPQGMVSVPVSPTFVIQNPDTGYVHELMSYGKYPHWMSDINWNNLFHSYRLPGTSASAPSQPAAPLAVDDTPTRVLLVGGTQNTDGSFDIAAMRPVDDPTGTLSASLAGEPTTGSHSLQLQALDGTVLASQVFTPITEDSDKQASFQFLIPYPDGVASVAILDNSSQVVYNRMVSSEAPQVSITSPTGSGTYDQSITLNWDASDADGNPLSFDIRYSPDGGTTWQGVEALLPSDTRSYKVDLTHLPGSENAFFKVIASNGLLTSEAINDAPLVISRKAPTASIDSIPDGARFSTEQVIRLEGTMMDAEDQPPFTDAAFVWTSDRDGTIGVGQNTTVYGLTPGRHKITLTVTDSDGMTGSASVNIVVWSPYNYLPLLKR